MLTREEVELTLQQARGYGGFGLDPFFESLRQHDKDMRGALAKKDEEIATLKERLHAAWPER